MIQLPDGRNRIMLFIYMIFVLKNRIAGQGIGATVLRAHGIVEVTVGILGDIFHRSIPCYLVVRLTYLHPGNDTATEEFPTLADIGSYGIDLQAAAGIITQPCQKIKPALIILPVEHRNRKGGTACRQIYLSKGRTYIHY